MLVTLPGVEYSLYLGYRNIWVMHIFINKRWVSRSG